METSSKNRQPSEANRTENHLCPTFNGTTCVEWLCFLPQWRSYMKHLGVEEIIVKGQFNGQPLETFKIESKCRSEIFISYFNSNLRATRGPIIRKDIADIFFEHCPWLPYYMRDMAIPVGLQYVYDSREITIGEPDLQYLEQCLVCFADSHISILSYMDPDSIWPPSMESFKIGNHQSPRLLPITINSFVNKLSHDKLLSEYLDEERLIRSIYGMDLAQRETLPTIDLIQRNQLDEYIMREMGTDHVVIFDRLVVSEHNAQINLSTSFRKASTLCLKAFKKLDDRCSAAVAQLLENGDFVSAYRKLQVDFIKKGMGDTEIFGNEAKAIKLLPGRDLNTHLGLIDKALRRWCQVLYLSKLIISFAASNKSSFPRRAVDYDQLDLTINEACIAANVGDWPDARILRDFPDMLLIPHATRYSILLNSLSGGGRERFSSVIAATSSMQIAEQSLIKLRAKLNNFELSNLGQSKLRDEQKNKKRQRDDDTMTPAAHVASSPPDPPLKKQSNGPSYPIGSCIHHPLSTTHRTENCRHGAKKVTRAPAKEEAHSKPNLSTSKPSLPVAMKCQFCFDKGRPSYNNHTEDRCFLKQPHLRTPRANAALSSSTTSSTLNFQILQAIRELSDKFTGTTAYEGK